jgi:hypothetical protein
MVGIVDKAVVSEKNRSPTLYLGRGGGAPIRTRRVQAEAVCFGIRLFLGVPQDLARCVAESLSLLCEAACHLCGSVS